MTGITQDELLFNDLSEHAKSFVMRCLLRLDERTQGNVNTVLKAGGTVDSRVSFKLDGSVAFAFDVVGPDGVRHELWRGST